jgi:hypothetical protein
VQTVFGICFVIFAEDRKLFEGYLENFLMLLKYHNLSGKPIVKPLQEVFFSINEQTWIENRKDIAIEYLQERSFFKRFTHNQLKQFLPKMKVKQFK